ncbi:MAG: SUMF1/EgtB/PvdO family nonheme iron enzyme [Planctomycetota bacterium]
MDLTDATLVAAWERTDRLFACVRRESFGERPIGLRYPLGFYVGHMPAFASNMLLSDLLGRETQDPALDRLFAFGIDPDEDAEQEPELSLPPIEATEAYRDETRRAILEALPEVLERESERLDGEGRQRLELVLEHELMHHETLLYLLQELGAEHKQPRHFDRVRTGPAARPLERIAIPAGEVELGCELGERSFVWDNELGRHRARVDAFVLDSLPVTIAAFEEFVHAGGYRERALWTQETWAWREKHDLEHPKDWTRRGQGFDVRSLFAVHALDTVSGWPVCVSWAEADAYARWRGGRLPSEAELARAAYTTPAGASREYPWGDSLPEAQGTGAAGFGFQACSPLPVGSTPCTDSDHGVGELVGNGWEWTSTAFGPFEGFQPYVEAYPGYSQDFFDGKHYVVFGGSWATDKKLLRRTFRNWYRFNYPYPFTKFRVARDV